jgi:hypothetical protein
VVYHELRCRRARGVTHIGAADRWGFENVKILVEIGLATLRSLRGLATTHEQHYDFTLVSKRKTYEWKDSWQRVEPLFSVIEVSNSPLDLFFHLLRRVQLSKIILDRLLGMGYATVENASNWDVVLGMVLF